MSAAMVPPLFQIFTGLGFLAVLLVGVLARPALKPAWGRVTALALLPLCLGMFLLSQATAEPSLQAGSDLFLAAGASFMSAIGMLAAALFLSAGRGAS